MFRSEEMELYSLIMNKDSAWEIMNEIGKADALQFIDLNAKGQIYHRPFTSYIRRCDEAERRIKYIEGECLKYQMNLMKPTSAAEFLELVKSVQLERQQSGAAWFDEVEHELVQKEERLRSQAKSYQEMKEKYSWILEYKDVLSKVAELQNVQLNSAYNMRRGRPSQDNMVEPLIPGIKISTIAGVIQSSEVERFKRLIFRLGRGNWIVSIGELNLKEDDKQNLEDRKSIYVVLYREGETSKAKIMKICDTFSKERFEIPENIQNKVSELEIHILETQTLLKASEKGWLMMLANEVEFFKHSRISKLEFLKWFVAKEKATYTTMNNLKSDRIYLRGVCWCPKSKIAPIKTVLEIMKSTHEIHTTFKQLDDPVAIPPTYLKTNDFLDPFQSIVSTYGIASYGEVNPAFFTTVTFPFLFGVMFGDVCHGLALFGVSLVLCLAKDRLIKSKSMLAPLINARYLFLLMGFFATFCGLIYNDFAGINLNFFPSCYKTKLDYEGEIEVEWQKGCVAPFGFDHFWRYSHKDLIFVNSFKMKISMIIAVLHMSLGVFMKLVNSLHFKEWIDVIFEFIPQIIFLLALFGYMDCLIVIKWLTHFEDTSKASSIISAVINLFLGMGNVTEKEEILNIII